MAEKSKRKGIIDLLYTKRCNEPEKPSMNLHELEDLLGCPREHLEFSLWYLKENGLVTRMDNGRFAVSAKGVDWAEQEEAAALMRADRLLPASSFAELTELSIFFPPPGLCFGGTARYNGNNGCRAGGAFQAQ